MLHGLSANLRRVSDMPSELIEEYLNGLPHLFRHGQSARDAHVLDGLSREPRITAWVCLNDDIASVALRYLQRRRRRVPEDVSVVGFDNRHIAARMNLTSYDFGFDKMGHLAVGCLAGQGRAAAQLVSRVTVEGDLVVRATAGSPRKAATVRPGMSLRPGLPAPGVSRHLEHR
jgi:DNA-binding LacI/PurR family transcriptional regulator